VQVYVNGKPVELPPGMRLKHALINAGLLQEIARGKKVYDEWDHEVGLDGALTEGLNLYVK
jgi:hypothetical protein